MATIEQMIWAMSKNGYRLAAAVLVKSTEPIDPHFRLNILTRADWITYDPEDPKKKEEINQEIEGLFRLKPNSIYITMGDYTFRNPRWNKSLPTTMKRD